MSEQVTILMGVFNGADHLPAQLQSLQDQDHTNWVLRCSDDGSDDASRQLLEAFADRNQGSVALTEGPKRGFSENYLHLIRALPENPGYVSFADQDDIWQPDKQSRALATLASLSDTPTLYASRFWYWYPNTDHRRASSPLDRPPSFCNALVENIATGNTIMLNPAAAQIARSAALKTNAVFAQDWWLYMLITGVGGRVIFDNGPPTLLYRQHDQNVIGGGQRPGQQVRRKVAAVGGAYAARLDSNIAALRRVSDFLSPENCDILDQFADARQASVLTRLRLLHRLGIYRQTAAGNIAFWGAAGLGRI